MSKKSNYQNNKKTNNQNNNSNKVNNNKINNQTKSRQNNKQNDNQKCTKVSDNLTAKIDNDIVNHSIENNEHDNSRLSRNIENNNSGTNDDMISFTNYDLDRKLHLSDTKRDDIERIFEHSYKSNNKKNNNIWKPLTLVLLISVIMLGLNYINLNEDYNKLQSDIAETEHNQNNEDNDSEKEPPELDYKEEKYLFLGDSIFEQYNVYDFFKGYNVINKGVSGITAIETFDKLEENVYNYEPTTIFMLLGTNDLYKGYSAQETYEHLKSLIDEIRENKPNITLNVLSVLPINVTENPKIDLNANVNRSNEKIIEINKMLKDYCDKLKINYVNVHDILLDEEGSLELNYTREGLHITDLGYHHITMELLKYMN